MEDGCCDQNASDDTLTNEPLLLSTPSNVRVGPFAREAQVSYLLGRVLRHAYEPTSDPRFDFDEAVALDRTLKAFRTLLPEEIDSCARYCGATGVCNRYFLHFPSKILQLTAAVPRFCYMNLFYYAK